LRRDWRNFSLGGAAKRFRRQAVDAVSLREPSRASLDPSVNARRAETEAADKSEHYNGVLLTRGRFTAEIWCCDGEVRTIGRYDSETAAALAFDQAVRFVYPPRLAEAVANFPFQDSLDALGGGLPDVTDFRTAYAALRDS